MDRADFSRRADIARLLKAGRWLVGNLQPTQDRVRERAVTTRAPIGVKVSALSTDDLAKREPLASNWWTGNRIARIERMEAAAGPADLDMLERALGLPGLFDQVSGPRSDVDPPAALTRPFQAGAPSVVQLPQLSFLRVAGQDSDAV